MPIDPLYAIAIVEEKRLVLPLINQKTAKETVQFCKELVAFFFVEMDQPITRRAVKFMAFSPEIGEGFRIGKTLAGKKESNIALLIAEGLPGGKGIFVCHPTGVYSQFRCSIRS